MQFYRQLQSIKTTASTDTQSADLNGDNANVKLIMRLIVEFSSTYAQIHAKPGST